MRSFCLSSPRCWARVPFFLLDWADVFGVEAGQSLLINPESWFRGFRLATSSAGDDEGFVFDLGFCQSGERVGFKGADSFSIGVEKLRNRELTSRDLARRSLSETAALLPSVFFDIFCVGQMGGVW